MRNLLTTWFLFALCVAALPARAEPLPAEERAFLDKHLSEVVQVTPTRLSDAAVTKVFAAAFYRIKVVIKQADGEASSECVAVRSGDKLLSFDRPGTDGDLPEWVKLFTPDFKLRGDADAQALQQALDTVCPIIGSDDQKAEGFRHAGKQWTFVRGKFFENQMGFVFETDASGTITSAKYVLKLP